MRGRVLLLSACMGFGGLATHAQSQPGPAYFLRHPGSGLLFPAVPSPGFRPALPASPGPTVRAAAGLSLPVATHQGSLPAAGEPAPRRDLTGPRSFPVYDPYQNLPEAYRKHTLPDARIEPLPVQLLRGLLGQ